MKINLNKSILAAISAFFLVLLYCLLAFTESGNSSAMKNPIQMNAENIAAGKAIFVEYCSGCHGPRADGRGQQGLNLVPKPQNLRNTQFIRYLTDERMFTSISGGVRGTSMPAFEFILSEQKRWTVMTYVRSLTADDEIDIDNALEYMDISSDDRLPEPVGSDMIANGGDNFIKYCARCHGEKADGNGVTSENLIPKPRNLVVVTSWGAKPFIDYIDDARLINSVSNGVPGTSMQPWLKVLSEEEKWEIVGFLRNEADKNRDVVVAN